MSRILQEFLVSALKTANYSAALVPDEQTYPTMPERASTQAAMGLAFPADVKKMENQPEGPEMSAIRREKREPSSWMHDMFKHRDDDDSP